MYLNPIFGATTGLDFAALNLYLLHVWNFINPPFELTQQIAVNWKPFPKYPSSLKTGVLPTSGNSL